MKFLSMLVMLLATLLVFSGCDDSDDGKTTGDVCVTGTDTKRCVGAKVEECVDGNWKVQETCNGTQKCIDHDVLDQKAFTCVDNCFDADNRCMDGQGCDKYSGECTGQGNCGDSMICSIRATGMEGCTEAAPGFWNNPKTYTVTGVVTGILKGKYAGLYIQEPNDTFVPYTSIFVSFKADTTGVENFKIGDLIEATDIGHLEYFCFPQLSIDTVDQVKATATVSVPAPAEVTAAELQEKVNAEKYEAALISMTGKFTVVQAGTGDNYYDTVVEDESGNKIHLSTSIIRFSDLFKDGYVYDGTIIGNWIYSYGIYRLQPRYSEDINWVYGDQCNGMCENPLTCNEETHTCIDKCASVNCEDGFACNWKTGTCQEDVGCGESTICQLRVDGSQNCTEESPGFYNGTSELAVTGVVLAKKDASSHPGLYIIDPARTTYGGIFADFALIEAELTNYSVGDEVSIPKAMVTDYFCFSQLPMKKVADISKTGETGTLPAAIELTAVEVVASATAEPYESMLVNVANGPFTVKVLGTSGNYYLTTVADKDGNEFHLSTTVFTPAPALTVDQVLDITDISGVLIYERGNYRVLLRDATDLQ